MDRFAFKSNIVRQCHEYWLKKCDGDRLPRRQDIRPEEIPRLLPYIFLVDVIGDPLAFKFRLVGTQITQWAARDFTGATLNAAEYGPQWQRVHDIYADVLRVRAPIHSEYEAPWHGRDFLTYERIVAPLSRDGIVVDMLFGALDVLPRDQA